MSEGYLKESPRGSNLAQPVFRLTEEMIQRKNKREMERAEEALQRLVEMDE
jgi:hypothetical protein